MLAERELSVDLLRGGTSLRRLLGYGLFILVALGMSGIAEMGGVLTLIILLVFMSAGAMVAVIFWRPVIGLYLGVFLDIAMEPETAGDSISKYTSYIHEDINTFAHAGIAFSPLELLLAVTTIAYLLRALGDGRLRGGPLARQVLVFGFFLLFGFVWGLANNGDWKTGLFEARGPFELVLVYFLVNGLVTEERQIARLLKLVVGSLGVVAIWGILRLVLIFHGNGGGADGDFGRNHEDAIMLGWLAIIWLLRLAFGGTARQKWLLLALAVPGLIAMFEMQRRAAFFSIALALVVLTLALYVVRRRLFFRVVPVAALLMALYSAAFWNSSSSLAEPLHAFKSVGATSDQNSRDYSSNLYRVQEMANVRGTILAGPLTGIGFGREFYRLVPMTLLDWWAFQYYTPHAQILWIWLKVGAGGFIAFWVVLGGAMLKAGDVVRRAGTGPLTFACLIAATYIVMILTFAYVDVGLALVRTEVPLGAMVGLIAVASRLAPPGTLSAAPATEAALGPGQDGR